MNIKKLKQSWQQSFENSVKSIDNYLQDGDSDYAELANFRILANWLLDNNYSSYDYLPKEHIGFKSTPFGTENLLAQLHHALCDDGDVSFVQMKKDGETLRVFMVFCWEHEEVFKKICQKENMELINSHIEGNKSYNRVVSALGKEEKKELTIDDFVFVAHKKPLVFIQEVEDFQYEQVKTQEENEVWLKKIKP